MKISVNLFKKDKLYCATYTSIEHKGQIEPIKTRSKYTYMYISPERKNVHFELQSGTFLCEKVKIRLYQRGGISPKRPNMHIFTSWNSIVDVQKNIIFIYVMLFYRKAKNVHVTVELQSGTLL